MMGVMGRMVFLVPMLRLILILPIHGGAPFMVAFLWQVNTNPLRAWMPRCPNCTSHLEVETVQL
jgi:hypothetical protein